MKKTEVILFLSILLLSLVGSAQPMDTIKISRVEVLAKQTTNSSAQQIDSSALENKVFQNLGELLSARANIFIKSYGIGSLSTVSLRGSGASHTNVLWNDILLNSSTNGVVDLALFPNLFSDKVEVNYGNTSLRSASGGIGGAIEISNEAEFKKKTTLQLNQQFGSFNFRNSELEYGFGNEKWQSKTRFLYRSADNNFLYNDLGEEGFPEKRVENAGLLQQSLMQSLHFRPKENQLLEAHLWYYESDRSLPVLTTVKNFNEQQKDESIRALLGFKHYFENSILSVKSAVLKDQILYENNRLNAAAESKNISSRTLVDFDLEKKKFSWNSRLNLDFEQAENPSFSDLIRRQRISAFSEFNYFVSDRLALNTGARQEFIVDEEVFFLPFVEMSFLWAKGVNLSLKASKNLKYPTLNDLYWNFGGNADLQAEENHSFELGLNYKKVLKKAYQISSRLTPYYSKIDNYIQWQPTAFGFWQATNLKEVEVIGLESSLGLESVRSKVTHSIFANYTFTQSRNLRSSQRHDASKNKQLVYVPEHQANVNFRIQLKGYSLNYQWTFVGARYLTSDNSDWLPYYQLSDLTLSKRIKKKNNNFQLDFSVLNLFDVEYQAIQWRPMPNRNYQIALSYNFQ